MTRTERRYDRLAVRPSLIISRLAAGEILSAHKPVVESGVLVRMLRRDFRERLIYLDLEYQSGYCRSRTVGSEMQMMPDVLTFARHSELAGLFPDFDRRLVNVLLMCDESPCVIAPASPAPSPSGALSFWGLIQAIAGCRRVTLIVEGRRYEHLAPCRPLIHQQAWYLVAEHEGHIATFILDEIHLIQPLQETFRRNDSSRRLVEDPASIQALPRFRSIQYSLLTFAPVGSPSGQRRRCYQPDNMEEPNACYCHYRHCYHRHYSEQNQSVRQPHGPSICNRCHTTDGRWCSRYCQCHVDTVHQHAGGYFYGNLCLRRSGPSDFRGKMMKRKTLPLLALVATSLFLSACDDRGDDLKAISRFKDPVPPRFSDVVSRQDDVSKEWSQAGFSLGLTLQVLRTRESPDGYEGGNYYRLVDVKEKTVQPLMNTLCIADNIKLEYHEVTNPYAREKYLRYFHDGKLIGRLLTPPNPGNRE